METVAQILQLDVNTLASGVIAVSIVLVAIFALGWKRANQRTLDLRNEFAAKRALWADANDRLVIEEQTTAQLNDALVAAENTIAARESALAAAREKVANLNRENDAVYANYVEGQKKLWVGGIELMYWQYFARRVLRISRSYLGKTDSLIQEALKDDKRNPNRVPLVRAIEPLVHAMELLELANASDFPQRIREMRADGSRPVIHLPPRLHDFLEEWEQRLGRRFETRIPLTDKAVLFAGSWTHLELVLATMFENGLKHSVDSTPIVFSFSSIDRMATFELTNWSAVPVSESIDKAKNEMMMGDPEHPRFGLHLLDQIASGYRAIMKLENVGAAADGSSHVVRATFTFSLR